MGSMNFPNAPQGWSTDDAEHAAKALGINLDDERWEVVQGLQDYFSHHEFSNRRELRDALDEKFHHLGGMKHLYQLFPGGPVAQGCQIAGVEMPAGTIDQSFGSTL